ncbi:MAG: serine hydrolase domain-containing protein [Planctomycetaceae bacterium]
MPTSRTSSTCFIRQGALFLSVMGLSLLLFIIPATGGELEEKIAAICESEKVPGMIAASVGPDGIIEIAAAGVRKRGTNNAMSTEDQFALGSNSKSFTATLAAALVEEGLIEWTTTIAEVWPKVSVDAGFKDVTLEQLLAHAGGLQRDLPLHGPEWSTFFDERYTPQQQRARMCALLLKQPPEGTIGKYDYSNLGFVVAAAMLEERGKKPFEQLMKQRVFVPLEMTHTDFFSTKRLKATRLPLVWGHKETSGEPIKPGDRNSENPTVYASCGTIRTTMQDWSKYIAWHMNESAGPVLKSDETLRHLHEPTVDRDRPGESYGSGWIQFQSGFGRTLQHAGNNTNQYSLTWVMPEIKRATLVITNTAESQAFKACDAATSVLMKSPEFR